MPKLKTNRAAAKRFRRTKGGALKRWKAGARHLLTHKTPKRKRNLTKSDQVSEQDLSRIEKMLPYI